MSDLKTEGLSEEQPREDEAPGREPAQPEDNSEPDKRPRQATIEMAQDEAGLWHWQLWTPNGRALACNVIGYGKRNDCLKAVMAAKEHFSRAKVVAQA